MREQTTVEPNSKIGIAARWYADRGHERRRAVIPTLRKKFGLSALQAIEAVNLASEQKQGDEPGK